MPGASDAMHIMLSGNFIYLKPPCRRKRYIDKTCKKSKRKRTNIDVKEDEQKWFLEKLQGTYAFGIVLSAYPCGRDPARFYAAID